MKIVSKDFCTFSGVYIAIYMGPCRRFYILLVQNFELPKCWTSEVPYSSHPISNYPTIQTVDIFYSLVRESICPPYLWSLFFNSSNLFPCLLWLNFEYWITYQLCRLRCKSATAYVLHNFSNVLADWCFFSIHLSFHWLSFCGVFSRCTFSLA